MNIKDIQDEIVDEFSMFDDAGERLEYLIDLGKTLPKIDEKYKISDNLIKGCQSDVWLHADYVDNKLLFTADSNAIIPKGIIAVLLRVFSNQTSDDIINVDPTFFQKDLNLSEYLNMNRSNGLSMMIGKIKLEALKFKDVKN